MDPRRQPVVAPQVIGRDIGVARRDVAVYARPDAAVRAAPVQVQNRLRLAVAVEVTDGEGGGAALDARRVAAGPGRHSLGKELCSAAGDLYPGIAEPVAVPRHVLTAVDELRARRPSLAGDR